MLFSAAKALFSFEASFNTFWDLCVSSHLTHANTCLLVIHLSFWLLLISLIISVNISSSFKPFINCSFNHPFLCIHFHSPLIWGSRSISQYFHFLLLLIYNNVMTKLFLYVVCLNVFLNTLNNSMHILHFLYSSLFRVCTNLGSYQPNQLNIIRLFLSSWVL